MSRVRLLLLALLVAALPAAGASAAPKPPPKQARAIQAAFGRFVASAVTRHDPGAAYALVTAAMRRGTTRAQWRKGDIPVYPYRAVGKRFELSYSQVSARDVLFDVLLHTKTPRKVGPVAFTVEMKRQGGRWLVASFVPVKVFPPEGSSRASAASAKQAPAGPNYADHGPLGLGWLVGLAIGLGVVFVLPLAVLAMRVLRDRRAQRRYDRGSPRTLPPLPSSYRPPDRPG